MKINKEDIGIESYPNYKGKGGQIASVPIRGVRLYYPKDVNYPIIDIRLQVERNQWKNKQIAEAIIELILEGEFNE